MSHKSLVSIALLLGILAQGRAAEYFIRPIVSRVDPHVIADSRATGLGFCAGIYWRNDQDNLEKEISVEFDRAKWSASVSDGFNLYNESETMMPIVLNLRVNVCPDSDLKRLRFYIGPCFGVARSTAKVHVTGEGEDLYSSDSDWDLAWGASVGFLIRVTSKVDIDIGYRRLGASNTKFQLMDESIASGTNTLDGLYLGVGMRF